ncbi:MAG: uroporphyrinogen-III synthase [Ignavibacteriales bacterium]|nr:MAG: uroporphyrinogen-III synthase [Ignavibacteriales bacterium]
MSLKNKTILVTKKKSTAEKYFCQLKDEGAKIIFFPTIKLIPQYESSELAYAINSFAEFDYLIFTSSNAVKVLAEIIKSRSLDLTNIKIAAVGEKTSEECYSNGIKVDILPEEFSSKGLINTFTKFDLNGKKIFIPCSSLSNEDLKFGLMGLGAEVDLVNVYDVVPNDLSELTKEYEEIISRQPDIYIFTSPSSFNNFIRLMNITNVAHYFKNNIICSIGFTTENAIKSSGLTVHIIPKMFSLQGISEAILKYFQLTVNMV